MKQILHVMIAAGILGLALCVPALAQDGTDWQATAEAADRRAWLAKATAQAARQQATVEAARATEAAQATATTQAIQAQATATAASIEATHQAAEMQSIQEARATSGARQEQSWSTQATATTQAIQAQATAQGYIIERERLITERTRAWQPVIVYAGVAALVICVILAVWLGNWLIARAFQTHSTPFDYAHGSMDESGDWIEGDYRKAEPPLQVAGLLVDVTNGRGE
jgi:hypothetical protein